MRISASTSAPGGNQPWNTVAGTNGTEAFRIQRDGEVQVFDLAGTGDALVGVNAAGELERITGSSDGLWDRDAANAETYLRNTNDQVGIGTANPDAKLHLIGSQGTGDPMLIRPQQHQRRRGVRHRFLRGDNQHHG